MDINDITFAYADKIDRLHHVDTIIHKGEITTIIGPNGSGKSTFLQVMSNNYKPQQGNIMLEDKLLSEHKSKELAKKLGVVHQHNTAPMDMTVQRLAEYGRLPYKTPFSNNAIEDEKIVNWALQATGLTSEKETPINNLSGGQQQRAWISMALAQNTSYLFLDEPTSSLDIYYQYEIMELIKQLNQAYHLTIVLVLHDINQAIQYSNWIIVMKEGKIIEKGPPADIITEKLIYNVYGVHVKIKRDEKAGMYILPTGI